MAITSQTLKTIIDQMDLPQLQDFCRKNALLIGGVKKEVAKRVREHLSKRGVNATIDACHKLPAHQIKTLTATLTRRSGVGQVQSTKASNLKELGKALRSLNKPTAKKAVKPPQKQKASLKKQSKASQKNLTKRPKISETEAFDLWLKAAVKQVKQPISNIAAGAMVPAAWLREAIKSGTARKSLANRRKISTYLGKLITEEHTNSTHLPPRIGRTGKAVAKQPATPHARHAIALLNLKNLRAASVERQIIDAPHYETGDYKALIENTIGAIHNIPRLTGLGAPTAECLKRVNLYIGRSSRNSSNLLNRWRTHQKDKKHQYGFVIGTCDLRNLQRFERYGVFLLDYLKQNDGLCISNKAKGPNGPMPKKGPGVIYLTCQIMRSTSERPARRITNDDIMKNIEQVLLGGQGPREIKSEDHDIAAQRHQLGQALMNPPTTPSTYFRNPSAFYEYGNMMGITAANDLRHTGYLRLIKERNQ